MPIRNPLHIHISITSDCNLRCIHCYGNYGFKKKEISFPFLKKLLDYIKDSVLYINLSGGEPTKYSKIAKEIISDLYKIISPLEFFSK